MTRQLITPDGVTYWPLSRCDLLSHWPAAVVCAESRCQFLSVLLDLAAVCTGHHLEQKALGSIVGRIPGHGHL